MRFSYDPEADALSLRLTDARIDDTDEVQPGIIIDYAEDGQVVAIEMLNVRKRSSQVDINIPSLNASVAVGKGIGQGGKGVGIGKGAVGPVGVAVGGKATGGLSDVRSVTERIADTVTGETVNVREYSR